MKVIKLINLAKAIANLPETQQGTSEEVAHLLSATQVKYTKTGDRTHLTIIDGEWEFEEFAGKYLRQQKSWKAAMAYALTMEYYEYADHINPGAWVRCEALSALMGFASGYTEDTPLEEFGDLESDRGVFFGSRNQLKVVTMTTETIYDVDDFLDVELAE